MTRREADDHLSLVAGMTRTATERLVDGGIRTLAQLGETAPWVPAPDMSLATFDRLRGQAALQLAGRQTGTLLYELLPPDPDRPLHGLAALPEPSPLDVFFDIEADPWIGDAGLEYLLGWSEVADGTDRYHPIWAHDRDEEKAAFEAFVDEVIARLERDPGMHVYHYASYEKAALRRLMSRYATREDEIDRILRAGVLVDLYQVVRQGLRASVDSYSIKRIERFYLAEREGPITRAGFSVVEYERWLGDHDPQHLRDLADYNRDDCVSTRGLRDWLEARRAEAEARFGVAFERPPIGSGLPTEAQVGRGRGDPATDRRADRWADRRPRAADATTRPPAGCSPRCSTGTGATPARPGGTTSGFASCRSTTSSARRSRSAGSSTTASSARRSSRSSTGCRFPPQDHKVSRGADGWEDEEGRGVTIHDIDDEHGVLLIKRGLKNPAPPPRALLKGQPIDARALRSALGRVADAVIEGGLDGPGPYRAIRDLLLRRPPRIDGDRLGSPADRAGRAGARRRAPAGARPARVGDRPRDPGAAGHRQDLDRRPDDRRARPGRPARRRLGPGPQGDHEPPRRDGDGRARSRRAAPGARSGSTAGRAPDTCPR